MCETSLVLKKITKKMFNITRNAHCWLGGYIINRLENAIRFKPNGPIHIFFSICDHFEPLWQNASFDEGLRRVKFWHNHYPAIADKHKDADGQKPKYTFFYPEEEYHEEYLDLLADLAKRGYGEVEIHLHHNNDTSDNLEKKLLNFKKRLFLKHKLLSKDKITNEIKYAFIHGNWALDNSRADGLMCGVNNELYILDKTGCFADLTLPSVPSSAQTQKVNSIYYAIDNHDRPKSHNWGKDVFKGSRIGQGLLILQGPLMLNWSKKKSGIFPTIENSVLESNNPLTEERIRLWLKANVQVKGQNNCVFVKLHAHGAQKVNSNILLQKELEFLYSNLEKNYINDDFRLHYLSAREMVNVICAIEEDCFDKMIDDDIEPLKNFRYVRP